jgi:hypothetical protein
MAPEFNLYVDQGTDFSETFTVTDVHGAPVNLTGATLRSQIRKSYTSTTSYDLTITPVDLATGQIKFELSNTLTASLKDGRYVYDAEYVLNGLITRFVKGLVTVYPRVTQVVSG